MTNQSKQAKVVALVGHCGPDSSYLRMAVSGAAPGARVVMVDSDEDLEAALGEGEIDLVMLNRKLDFGFEESDGIKLLERIKSLRPAQKLMMISNYPEAQQAAESAGALPGFGKREIGSAKVKERISAALNGVE
jgi:CheY-like chemotaxis protein